MSKYSGLNLEFTRRTILLVIGVFPSKIVRRIKHRGSGKDVGPTAGHADAAGIAAEPEPIARIPPGLIQLNHMRIARLLGHRTPVTLSAVGSGEFEGGRTGIG